MDVWSLLMSTEQNLPSLSSIIVKQIWKQQLAALLILFSSFCFVFTVYYVEKVRYDHLAQSQLMHEHIDSNILEVTQQIKNIAENDLVINALIDLEQRSSYLPLLFQSMRINSVNEFSIAYLDFSGQIITQRQFDESLMDHYRAQVLDIVISNGEPLQHLNESGLLIAIPVMLNELSEGAIVFHVKHLSNIIPTFKTDLSISVSEISGGEIYSVGKTGQSIEQSNDEYGFTHTKQIGSFNYRSYQPYAEALNNYFVVFVFTAVVLILALLGAYVVTKIAAVKSQDLLNDFAFQLDAYTEKRTFEASSHIELTLELNSIQQSFERVFGRLHSTSLNLSRLNVIFNGLREFVILLDNDKQQKTTNYAFDNFAANTHFNMSQTDNLLAELEYLSTQHKTLHKISLTKQYHSIEHNDEVWINWYLAKIEVDSASSRYILVGQDITARRIAEEDLLIKNAAIEKANTSIIIADVSKQHQPIIFANQAYADLTGYELKDVLGKNCNLLQGEKTEPEKVEAIRKAIKSMSPLDITLTNYKANGEPFLNRLMLSPVDTNDSTGRYFVGIQQDITDEVNAQNYLKRAKTKAEESTRLKSDFLARMSHEIRTPINGISGTLQLLNKTELDPYQTRFISLAIQSTRNLLSIINDILDFSKIEAGKLSIERYEFDVEDLIHKTVDSYIPLIQDKNIKLIKQVELNDETSILGDAVRIRQIMDNLINNAIKFTTQGEISISVNLLSNQDGVHSICFAITDSGIGISEEKLNTIFHHFIQEDNSTTRKYGGSGLGLSICKQLCDLMKGDICVESEKGVGSTFRVSLPTSIVKKKVVTTRTQSTLPVDISKCETVPSEHTCNVLIVEDNELNRIIACEQLTSFNLFTAADGQQALQLLNNKHSCIDVILMDCQMPVMDGYTCCRAIRAGDGGKRYADIPVIALTANAMKGDREKCLEAGMNDYVSKPFTSEQLTAAVSHWYNRSINKQRSMIEKLDLNNLL